MVCTCGTTGEHRVGCSKRPSSSSVVRLSYLVVRKRRTSYLARYASRGTLHGIRFFDGGLFQHPASVPSNVAEGAGRQTKKEFINYLHMAQGSLSELDTHLELARRLGYLVQDSWAMLDRQDARIDKMLSGLIRHQKANGVKSVAVRP